MRIKTMNAALELLSHGLVPRAITCLLTAVGVNVITALEDAHARSNH
jgi:hypothetical protein